MSEANIIEQTTAPLTVESLAAQFSELGLAAGQTVLVHSAMSKLGWVVGGAEAVTWVGAARGCDRQRHETGGGP
jgi:aminoglycoside 3-N-acetyltransferase